MNSFWETFYALCWKNNTYPNVVAKELGFSSGSATLWKKGTLPRRGSLKKIADYFGVSVEYLVGEDSAVAENGQNETVEGKPEISDDELKFALFGGDAEYISEEKFREIKSLVSAMGRIEAEKFKK